MSKKEQDTVVENVNDTKMDAIKQLIFGENMVEYDQRFQKMMEKLEDTHRLLEEKIEQLDHTLNATIVDLNSEFESKRLKLEDDFNIAFDKLDNKKTDRKALGKMLETIGTKLQA
ncbi:MAG: hypothetical protein JKY48_11440 [Flavobacteriales bacterium]|nr:hypothetical protein [Flavobacteriales bacterium]